MTRTTTLRLERFYFMGILKDRTGEKYNTNQGYIVEIIKYKSYSECTVRFDNGFVLENQYYNWIKKGVVKNPFHKSVFGVGMIGVGSYNISYNKFNTLVYRRWSGMLQRCYSGITRYNSYSDCVVCEEWHNLQSFGKWFEMKFNPVTMNKWHLDKDILFKNNKIYSPETCCLVPAEINGLFIRYKKLEKKLPIGVISSKGKYHPRLKVNNKTIHLPSCESPEEAFYLYKNAKEKHICLVAEKWKGIIEDRVYYALINYKVEITD